jgi:hypothetical protein
MLMLLDGVAGLAAAVVAAGQQLAAGLLAAVRRCRAAGLHRRLVAAQARHLQVPRPAAGP